MANNVNFNIQFHEMNDKAKKTLESMLERIRKDGDYSWLGDIFVDGKELTYEQSEQYSWTTEHIGPKWCYLEEWDTDSIMGVAAWSAPQDGLEKLLRILAKDDPNMITTITYEDEAPNFAGAIVYCGSNLEDMWEDDSEEIRDLTIRVSQDLSPDDYDAEEWEWVDEEKEEIYENEVWEAINDYQWNFVSETVARTKEYLAENV